MAALVAFVGIVVFMVAVYGFFGVIASVGMVMNIVLLIALMTVLGATLTMPGIAGLVLSIGMAVDANVLIFERIREELKTARGAGAGDRARLREGVVADPRRQHDHADRRRSSSTPWARGRCAGFGVTLALGLLCSVFTAISLSRLIVAYWYDWRRPKTVTI